MKPQDLKIILLPTKTYKVDEKLLRGNAIFSPIKMAKIKRKGVTQVIDFRNETNKASIFLRKLEKLYCKIFNIKYENPGFSLSPTKIPSNDFFNGINESIKENKGKTYVHCFYGKHRTGFGIAMYEKSTGKTDSQAAENMVKTCWADEMAKDKLDMRQRKTLDAFFAKFFPNNIEILNKYKKV